MAQKPILDKLVADPEMQIDWYDQTSLLHTDYECDSIAFNAEQIVIEENQKPPEQRNRIRRSNAIKEYYRYKWQDYQIKMLIALYDQFGLDYEQLSEVLGKHPLQIKAKLHRLRQDHIDNNL